MYHVLSPCHEPWRLDTNAVVFCSRLLYTRSGRSARRTSWRRWPKTGATHPCRERWRYRLTLWTVRIIRPYGTTQCMARSTLKRTWPSGLKLCLLKPGLSHCQCSVRLSARTRPARNLVAVLFLCTLIDIVYESTHHTHLNIHTYTQTPFAEATRATTRSLARSLASIRRHTYVRIQGRLVVNTIGMSSVQVTHDRGSWRVLEGLRCRTLERWFLAGRDSRLRFETQISASNGKKSSSSEVNLN